MWQACPAARAASLRPPGAPCGGRHPPPLELRGGCRNRRCPAWLVHACIAVSLGGWHAPEETGRFGGEEDGMGVQRRKASRARQGCSTHSCRIASVAHARVLCTAMHTHSRFARPYRPSRAAFFHLSGRKSDRRIGVNSLGLAGVHSCAHIGLLCRLAAIKAVPGCPSLS